MSDILCPRCGEPWDLESLHDVAADEGISFGEVRARFMTKGCAGLAGDYFGPIAVCERDEHAATRAALADLMGDDVDGYIATLEDVGL